MSTYLRLEEPPALKHPGYPICGACVVETEHEDADWLCPSCGTVWPGEDLESEPERAQMWPAWSGEEWPQSAPVCPNDDAWKVARLTGQQRDQEVRRINGTEQE